MSDTKSDLLDTKSSPPLSDTKSTPPPNQCLDCDTRLSYTQFGPYCPQHDIQHYKEALVEGSRLMDDTELKTGVRLTDDEKGEKHYDQFGYYWDDLDYRNTSSTAVWELGDCPTEGSIHQYVRMTNTEIFAIWGHYYTKLIRISLCPHCSQTMLDVQQFHLHQPVCPKCDVYQLYGFNSICYATGRDVFPDSLTSGWVNGLRCAEVAWGQTDDYIQYYTMLTIEGLALHVTSSLFQGSCRYEEPVFGNVQRLTEKRYGSYLRDFQNIQGHLFASTDCYTWPDGSPSEFGPICLKEMRDKQCWAVDIGDPHSTAGGLNMYSDHFCKYLLAEDGRPDMPDEYEYEIVYSTILDTPHLPGDLMVIVCGYVMSTICISGYAGAVDPPM